MMEKWILIFCLYLCRVIRMEMDGGRVEYTIIWHSGDYHTYRTGYIDDANEKWLSLKSSGKSRIFYGKEIYCWFKNETWMNRILQQAIKQQLPIPKYMAIYHKNGRFHFRGFYGYANAEKYYDKLNYEAHNSSRLFGEKNTIIASWFKPRSKSWFGASTNWRQNIVNQWLKFYTPFDFINVENYLKNTTRSKL